MFPHLRQNRTFFAFCWFQNVHSFASHFWTIWAVFNANFLNTSFLKEYSEGRFREHSLHENDTLIPKVDSEIYFDHANIFAAAAIPERASVTRLRPLGFRWPLCQQGPAVAVAAAAPRLRGGASYPPPPQMNQPECQRPRTGDPGGMFVTRLRHLFVFPAVHFGRGAYGCRGRVALRVGAFLEWKAKLGEAEF